MQERLQRFGGWLAGMVIPNIGAFIAWGLMTALVIPQGWLAKLGVTPDVWQIGDDGEAPGMATRNLVDPMLQYLLPTLVAFTGGKLVHGHRGGVLAAIAVFGVIGGATFEVETVTGLAGETPPQFLGAMAIGPLAGWVMKQLDGLLEPVTPVGFEMLFNNFSQGFAGLGLAALGYLVIGPLMGFLAGVFEDAVTGIESAGFLPLADVPIEVAKVLFLNNALNHGVLTPLGTAEVDTTGRSVFYLLETNPGPGLGLLGAYFFASRGLAKMAASGAAVIHFIGGIHEVYFPYVLMNPVMIGAMWAGGISADLIFVATDAGLTAPASPGSIIAYIIALPPESGAAFGVIAGVVVGAMASFFVGSILLRMFPVAEMTDLEETDSSVADAMPDVPGMNLPGASP